MGVNKYLGIKMTTKIITTPIAALISNNIKICIDQQNLDDNWFNILKKYLPDINLSTLVSNPNKYINFVYTGDNLFQENIMTKLFDENYIDIINHKLKLYSRKFLRKKTKTKKYKQKKSKKTKKLKQTKATNFFNVLKRF